jgi:hypothetical protein
VASHQPSARSNCGGAETAAVVSKTVSGEFMKEVKAHPERPDHFPTQGLPNNKRIRAPGQLEI